jgi:hypothetical protein
MQGNILKVSFSSLGKYEEEGFSYQGLTLAELPGDWLDKVELKSKAWLAFDPITPYF